MRDKVDIRLFLTELESALAEADPAALDLDADLSILDSADEAEIAKVLAPIFLRFIELYSLEELTNLWLSSARKFLKQRGE